MGVDVDRPVSRSALTVLLLASTLTVMAGALLSPIVALVADDLELSGTRAGLVVTLHALSLAVASPAVGMFVDRHGPRIPLAAGLALYGLAGGAGALAPGTRHCWRPGSCSVWGRPPSSPPAPWRCSG